MRNALLGHALTQSPQWLHNPNGMRVVAGLAVELAALKEDDHAATGAINTGERQYFTDRTSDIVHG